LGFVVELVLNTFFQKYVIYSPKSKFDELGILKSNIYFFRNKVKLKLTAIEMNQNGTIEEGAGTGDTFDRVTRTTNRVFRGAVHRLYKDDQIEATRVQMRVKK
jgi:hypothetical protein